MDYASSVGFGVAMGASTGLEELGETAITRIAQRLTARFGKPTATFERSSGAIQTEWTNVQTAVKHILAGPETHEIRPGQGPVEHYNYEVQRPTAKPGRYETTNNVHLDAEGKPIE